MTQTRTDLDLDRFDNPIDARVYVTYVNNTNRPITAVNFRIRLTDNEGKNLATFHGGDAVLVGGGEQHSQKWKNERINPKSAFMQIRVLQVRYADGQVWESAKMQQLRDSQSAAAPPDDDIPSAQPPPAAADPQPAPQRPLSQPAEKPPAQAVLEPSSQPLSEAQPPTMPSSPVESQPVGQQQALPTPRLPDAADLQPPGTEQSSPAMPVPSQ